jgi:hypothetical protein
MYLINDPAPFKAMAESYKARRRNTMDEDFGTEDMEENDAETSRVEDVPTLDGVKPIRWTEKEGYVWSMADLPVGEMDGSE